jgi:anaerobic selenocysteine-containing dehydrogenase
MWHDEPDIALSEHSAAEIKTTTCYMCACRCGIRVHLKNGRVRYIDGNRDHPVNKGVLCGKGAAGIMQHTSPSRLRAPLKRVGPRGSGEFVEISWDEALSLAAGWLKDVRTRDPSKLAFFTGRDQSQALTGWFAQQFGTPNYAAHGGFCSVNMAAAGLYTFGGSFWEFGEPIGTTPAISCCSGGGGSRFQSAQDGARQAQGQGRQGCRHQPDPHRLRRDRRRMDRRPARHRWIVRRRVDP